jgi:hypothetical protein
LDQQQSNQLSTWVPPAADINDQPPDVETHQQLEDAMHELEGAREDACPSESPAA